HHCGDLGGRNAGERACRGTVKLDIEDVIEVRAIDSDGAAGHSAARREGGDPRRWLLHDVELWSVAALVLFGVEARLEATGRCWRDDRQADKPIACDRRSDIKLDPLINCAFWQGANHWTS